MKRREFIRNILFTTVGGVLLPNSIAAAAFNDNLLEKKPFDGKVLVIGAGAAGLYAGYLLKSKGIDFQILEASSIYGGRLGKLTGFADFPIDLGAQWLHGKKNLVGNLIASTKTKITLDDSDEKYWFKNRIVSQLPEDIDIFEGEQLPDISYKEYAIKQGLGDDYQWIVESIAGDQGADSSRLSVYWNNKEEEGWSSGDEDFKFRDTYFDLIDQQIAATVRDRIRLNTPVTRIDYSLNSIVVTVKDGSTYDADKIIITVPITILKSNSIQFVPALPREKLRAFSKIGMDAGMKVFLKFKRKFYDENISGGNICASYVDDSIGKSGKDNVLFGFIMGKQAEHLTSLGSDRSIVSALLRELDSMYGGKATANFVKSYVQNWTTHPFIRGAYSYSTVGMGNSRELAAKPVNKKLFFAGEAMNLNGHHQTAHGAIETGYREVVNLMKP